MVSLHSLLTINLLDPGRRWFVVQRNFAGVYIRGEELESMLSKG